MAQSLCICSLCVTVTELLKAVEAIFCDLLQLIIFRHRYQCLNILAPERKSREKKESKRFKRLIKHCTAKSSTASIKRENFHELSFTEMSANSQLEERQGVPVSLALFELITAKVSMETKTPVWPVLSESQKDGKINCGGKSFYTAL